MFNSRYDWKIPQYVCRRTVFHVIFITFIILHFVSWYPASWTLVQCFKLFSIQYTIIGTCIYFLVLHTHRKQYILRLIVTINNVLPSRSISCSNLNIWVKLLLVHLFFVLILIYLNTVGKRVKLEQSWHKNVFESQMCACWKWSSLIMWIISSIRLL